MRFFIKSWLVSVFLVTNVYAVECYITMVKGSCWKNYNLTVNIYDASTNENLGDINVWEGDLWARKSFSCSPGQVLSLEAKFTPIIWDQDEGKAYRGLRFWKLPDRADENVSGWNVTVCYPESFADVPVPPGSSGKCECDIKNIPKLRAEDL